MSNALIYTIKTLPGLGCYFKFYIFRIKSELKLHRTAFQSTHFKKEQDTHTHTRARAFYSQILSKSRKPVTSLRVSQETRDSSAIRILLKKSDAQWNQINGIAC